MCVCIYVCMYICDISLYEIFISFSPVCITIFSLSPVCIIMCVCMYYMCMYVLCVYVCVFVFMYVCIYVTYLSLIFSYHFLQCV
jgi:hypothetical protein